jgi:hypothetical protein
MISTRKGTISEVGDLMIVGHIYLTTARHPTNLIYDLLARITLL